MSIRLTGMSSGLDTDAMVKDLVNSYSKRTDKMKGEQTKLSWKQDAWKAMNTKVTNFFNKSLSNMRFSTSYSAKKTTASNESKVAVVAGDNAINGSQKLKIKELAQTSYITGADLRETKSDVSGSTRLGDLCSFEDGEEKIITIKKGNGEAVECKINADTKMSDVVKAFNSQSGITSSYDANNGRIFVSSDNSGSSNNITLGGDATVLNALGLTENSGASILAGKDALIELNGAEFTSNTNTFTINGLTITAREKTGDDEEISLVTDTDYDQIYDKIKSFIKEYSSLINDLDKAYNAPSADKYAPLTSEEKEAMTDEEIEKWETKIKDSLLKKDSSVSTLSSIMRESMLQTYDVGGTKYSLSSFGISTLSYFIAGENEKNAYHIDGDADDSDTSGEKDKLKSMIASNPEAVTGFFTKLATNMYDKLRKQINATSTYKSFGSAYDDKKLQSEYDDYTKKLSDWESKIADIEDRYYKQFTAMESALSSLQSQQTYMTNLFG